MQPLLLRNATIASLLSNTRPYGLIEDAAVAMDGGLISWVGQTKDIPKACKDWPELDLQKRLVTPALIDCHTHVVYGGNRAREFEMRLLGKSYAEIARAGGGIAATVEATRSMSPEDLLNESLKRVDRMIAEGVSLLEIKSGYGLDRDTELTMLRVARRIGELRAIRIRTSFLGAHTVPAEYRDHADDYIDQVCLPALDAAHQEGLVDAVDGFCESIAFSAEQIERVFRHARQIDLPVKLHTEQLSLQQGASLAARFSALSADHLEYLDEPGVAAMAKAGTVAVLLPGAFYHLREQQLPPVHLLRKYHVPMAVATDCNPGSSPLTSIQTAMNMACILFGLSPEESLRATTRHAARALGVRDCGLIKSGMRADIAVWDLEHPAELSYAIGFNPLVKRYFGGLQ